MPKLSKEQQAAARQKLKDARHGIHSTGSSALDEVDLDEEDVYDVVDESAYEHLVQSRRQREDFVVDDDGLGYHDDGEETYGDELNDESQLKKKRQQQHANATLTSKTLRKARKGVQQSAAAARAASAAAGAGEGKNRSMWEFVNKAGTTVGAGNTTSGNAATQSSLSSSSSNKRPNVSVDALLGQLDDPDFMAARKKTKNNYARKNAGHSTRQRMSSSSGRRGGGCGAQPLLAAASLPFGHEIRPRRRGRLSHGHGSSSAGTGRGFWRW